MLGWRVLYPLKHVHIPKTCLNPDTWNVITPEMLSTGLSTAEALSEGSLLFLCPFFLEAPYKRRQKEAEAAVLYECGHSHILKKQGCSRNKWKAQLGEV